MVEGMRAEQLASRAERAAMMAKIVRLEREVAALQGRDEGSDEGNQTPSSTEVPPRACDPPPDDATATAIARLK